MAKLQKVVFTLNNYSESDYDRIKLFIELNAVYGIIGREIAPTGTHHLQGFANFGRTNRKTFKILKGESAIGPKAHIEKAVATDEQNKTYCSKDGMYWEHGEVQSPGKRNDLQAVAEAIESGRTIEQVANDFPVQFIKYHRGIQALKSIRDQRHQRKEKTEVHVLIGPPGSGKSRYANAKAISNGSTYYKPRGEWWDGYEGQTSVVIDDFYGWLKYDDLLKIMDRYPYQVPVKGGYRQFTSKYIYITSNVDVDRWYKFEGYTTTALFRRIEHYHVDYVPDTMIYDSLGMPVMDLFDMQDIIQNVSFDDNFDISTP
ncbi:MAG: helicase [Circoviridae sp.]|nr:MAG: helicase [Circoviridae sp.]